MLFKQTTSQVEFDDIEGSFTYHIFYTESDDKSELEPLDDIDLFLGTDYGTSVLCKDKDELDKLLNEIDVNIWNIKNRIWL